ncbi:hypothetical protein [Aquirufa aurantiipilula]|uniref:Uncharacterized protein n=1 Tax=Aquirufa aurantiipilula TaxID=2696561 RepID=A0ABT6BJV3_9BACT|nr:hypothetical protein [Aquirufa aurantiipilula]MDF5690752.1 hypothetical protein [Aquirufa aurantiipilula]
MNILKVSAESIRRANSKGVDFNKMQHYKGIIVVKTNLNGTIRVREISREMINEAYEKSLRHSAEEL